VITAEELQSFLESSFPQTACTVDSVSTGEATLRHTVGFEQLRPGGTVSGPVMMELADCALYVALLAEIGIVPLAVTTSLSINFMRKPAADRDLIGVCRLLKVGKTLAVGEVSIYSEGMDAPVAHATGTYAIPPGKPATE
jgi:uncharacterized protein (TIGR00369 family)